MTALREHGTKGKPGYEKYHPNADDPSARWRPKSEDEQALLRLWTGNGGKPASEDVERIGRLVASAPHTEGEVYRGISVADDVYESYLNLTPGHVFDWPLAAFSWNLTVAFRFAITDQMGRATGDKPVIFVLRKGAHAIDLHDINLTWEQEMLTGGRFRVERVRETTDFGRSHRYLPQSVLQIVVRQVEPPSVGLAEHGTKGKPGYERYHPNSVPRDVGSRFGKIDTRRLGRCYELAGGRLIDEGLSGHGDEGFKLVHGTIQGFGAPRIKHAWVVLPDGRIWEPISEQVYERIFYDAIFNPTYDLQYEYTAAAKEMVKTRHWGPWEEYAPLIEHGDKQAMSPEEYARFHPGTKAGIIGEPYRSALDNEERLIGLYGYEKAQRELAERTKPGIEALPPEKRAMVEESAARLEAMGFTDKPFVEVNFEPMDGGATIGHTIPHRLFDYEAGLDYPAHITLYGADWPHRGYSSMADIGDVFRHEYAHAILMRLGKTGRTQAGSMVSRSARIHEFPEAWLRIMVSSYAADAAFGKRKGGWEEAVAESFGIITHKDYVWGTLPYDSKLIEYLGGTVPAPPPPLTAEDVAALGLGTFEPFDDFEEHGDKADPHYAVKFHPGPAGGKSQEIWSANYVSIQSALRAGKTKGSFGWVDESIVGLDAAMAPIPEPMDVYRFTGPEQFDLPDAEVRPPNTSRPVEDNLLALIAGATPGEQWNEQTYDTLQPYFGKPAFDEFRDTIIGRTFTDLGYLATSEKMGGFYQRDSEGNFDSPLLYPFRLDLHVPAGIRAAHIAPWSRMGEKEWLLDRGLTFRVTDIERTTKRDENNRQTYPFWIVKAEVLLPGMAEHGDKGSADYWRFHPDTYDTATMDEPSAKRITQVVEEMKALDPAVGDMYEGTFYSNFEQTQERNFMKPMRPLDDASKHNTDLKAIALNVNTGLFEPGNPWDVYSGNIKAGRVFGDTADPLRSLVVHEYGHLVARYYAGWADEATQARWRTAMAKAVASPDMSEYGRSAVQEGWAEAWVAYVLRMDNEPARAMAEFYGGLREHGDKSDPDYYTRFHPPKGAAPGLRMASTGLFVEHMPFEGLGAAKQKEVATEAQRLHEMGWVTPIGRTEVAESGKSWDEASKGFWTNGRVYEGYGPVTMELTNRMRLNGYAASRTPGDVFRHEYAHVLVKSLRDDYVPYPNHPSHRLAGLFTGWLGANTDAISKTVSRYAYDRWVSPDQNWEEAFAEAFSIITRPDYVAGSLPFEDDFRVVLAEVMGHPRRLSADEAMALYDPEALARHGKFGEHGDPYDKWGDVNPDYHRLYHPGWGARGVAGFLSDEEQKNVLTQRERMVALDLDVPFTFDDHREYSLDEDHLGQFYTGREYDIGTYGPWQPGVLALRGGVEHKTWWAYGDDIGDTFRHEYAHVLIDRMDYDHRQPLIDIYRKLDTDWLKENVSAYAAGYGNRDHEEALAEIFAVLTDEDYDGWFSFGDEFMAAMLDGVNAARENPEPTDYWDVEEHGDKSDPNYERDFHPGWGAEPEWLGKMHRDEGDPLWATGMFAAVSRPYAGLAGRDEIGREAERLHEMGFKVRVVPTVRRGDAAGGYNGAFYPGRKELALNPEWKPTGFSASRTIGDTFRHEYGHAVWFATRVTQRKELAAAVNWLAGQAKGDHEMEEWVLGLTSRYFVETSSVEERWAEFFAIITRADYNPGTLPGDDKVWEVLRGSASMREHGDPKRDADYYTNFHPPKGEAEVVLPDTLLPVGFGHVPGDGYGGSPQIYMQDVNAYLEDTEGERGGTSPYLQGQTIRGHEVISPDDPRVPDTVYHVTTNLPAVLKSGYLRPGGAGGLGGDNADRLVSITISKEIAEGIADATVINALAYQQPLDRLPYWLRDLAQQEGWLDRSWSMNAPYWEGDHPTDLHYSHGDWLRLFFADRDKSTDGRLLNPLFFGDWGRNVDPAKVGIVSIPRDALRNGALLVDFDLGGRFLEEIRSYGPVRINGTVPLREHGDPDINADYYTKYHPRDTANVATPPSVVEFEQKWAKISPKSEAFLIVDADGNALQAGMGTRARATSQHIDTSLLRPGATLTHFHPEPNYSPETHLSYDDINNALKRGYTIRAFQKNGSWQQFVPHPQVGGYGTYLDITDRELTKKARAWAEERTADDERVRPYADPTDERDRLLEKYALRKGVLTHGVSLAEHGDKATMSPAEYGKYHPNSDYTQSGQGDVLSKDSALLHRLETLERLGPRIGQQGLAGDRLAPTEVARAMGFDAKPEVVSDLAPYIADGEMPLRRAHSSRHLPQLMGGAYTIRSGTFGSGIYAFRADDPQKGWTWYRGMTTDVLMTLRKEAKVYDLPIADWRLNEELTDSVAGQLRGWGFERMARWAALDIGTAAMLSGYDAVVVHEGSRVREVIVLNRGMLRIQDPSVPLAEHGDKGRDDYWKYHPETAGGTVMPPAGLTNTELVKGIDPLPDDTILRMYHGTTAAAAEAILDQKLLKPDDLNSVGLTSDWWTAKGYGGYKTPGKGVVLEVLVRRGELGRSIDQMVRGDHSRWLSEEMGGTGYDSVLIYDLGHWPGVPLEGARIVRRTGQMREHGTKGEPGYEKYHPGSVEPGYPPDPVPEKGGLGAAWERVKQERAPVYQPGEPTQYADEVVQKQQAEWSRWFGEKIGYPTGPPGEGVLAHFEYGDVALMFDEAGYPVAQVDFSTWGNQTAASISGVSVRGDQRGKGWGHRLYDFVQDHTPINLYDVIGQSHSFTPPGKAFALAWLQHRAKVEGVALRESAEGLQACYDRVKAAPVSEDGTETDPESEDRFTEHGDKQAMTPAEYATYHPGVKQGAYGPSDWKAEREERKQALADGISARVAEFRAQGGVIETEPEHGVGSDGIIDMMAADMGDHWDKSRGTQFTRQAIERGRKARREKPDMASAVITAWTMDPDSGYSQHVAGAVNWFVMDEYRIPFGKTYKRKYMYLDYVGSTGILKGVGSALTREVVLEAAKRKLPLLLTADPPALSYWQDVWGMQRNPFNFDLGGTMSRMSGSDSLYGLSKDQVQDLAKRLKADGTLINAHFTEIAVEVEGYDPDAAPFRDLWLATLKEHGDPDTMGDREYRIRYHPGPQTKTIRHGTLRGTKRTQVAKPADQVNTPGYLQQPTEAWGFPLGYEERIEALEAWDARLVKDKEKWRVRNWELAAHRGASWDSVLNEAKYAWITNAFSPSTVLLQQGVVEALGATGNIWTAGADMMEMGPHTDSVVKALYEATQESLKGVGTMTLYRGVGVEPPGHNVLESWTDNINIARQFAGLLPEQRGYWAHPGVILKAEVPVSAIFLDLRSGHQDELVLIGDRIPKHSVMREHGDPQRDADYYTRLHPAKFKGNLVQTDLGFLSPADRAFVEREEKRLVEMGHRLPVNVVVAPEGGDGLGEYLSMKRWDGDEEHWAPGTIRLDPNIPVSEYAKDFAVSRDMGDVFRHEYAHALLDALPGGGPWSKEGDRSHFEAIDIIDRWAYTASGLEALYAKEGPTDEAERARATAARDRLMRSISAYALVGGEEQVAEAFTLITRPDYKMGTLPFDADLMSILTPLREHGSKDDPNYSKYHPDTATHTGAAGVSVKRVPVEQLSSRGAIASYNTMTGQIEVSDDWLLGMDEHGAGNLYYIGWDAQGNRIETSGHRDFPAAFVRGYGGTTHDFAHEVGHAWESQTGLDSTFEWDALGTFDIDKGFVGWGPDTRRSGDYPVRTTRNASETLADVFADYVQVPDMMKPEVRAWVEAHLGEWSAVVEQLRTHPDPRDWIERPLAEHGDKSDPDYERLYHPGWGNEAVQEPTLLQRWEHDPSKPVFDGLTPDERHAVLSEATRLRRLGYVVPVHTRVVPWEYDKDALGYPPLGEFQSGFRGPQGDWRPGAILMTTGVPGDQYTGYSFGTTIRDTFRHEYAHALIDFLPRQDVLFDKALVWATNQGPLDTEGGEWIEAYISSYALDNIRMRAQRSLHREALYNRGEEFVAEAFSVITAPGYVKGSIPFDEELLAALSRGRGAPLREHGDKGDPDYEAKYHPGSGDWRKMFVEEEPFANAKPLRSVAEDFDHWRSGAARLHELGFTRRIEQTFAINAPEFERMGIYRLNAFEEMVGTHGLFLAPDDTFIWRGGPAAIGLNPTLAAASLYKGLSLATDYGDIFRHEYGHFLLSHLNRGAGYPARARIKTLVNSWVEEVGPDESTRVLGLLGTNDWSGEERWAEAFMLMTDEDYVQGAFPFDAEVFSILREQGLMRSAIAEHGDKSDPNYARDFHPGSKGTVLGSITSDLPADMIDEIQHEAERMWAMGVRVEVERVSRLTEWQVRMGGKTLDDVGAGTDGEAGRIYFNPVFQKPVNGYSFGDTVGDVFRHETAHIIWAQMSQYERSEVIDLLYRWSRANPTRVTEGLSRYAADAMFNLRGEPPAEEAFAEAFAVLTHPDYKPGALKFDAKFWERLRIGQFREHGDPKRDPDYYTTKHPPKTPDDEKAIRAWTGYVDPRYSDYGTYVTDDSGAIRAALRGEGTHEQAERLVALTASAPHSEVPLYRGIAVSDESFARLKGLKPGETYSMNLSAWSSDITSAHRYMDSYEGERKTGSHRVLFALSKGAHALSTEGMTPLAWEKEYLTQGAFRVLKSEWVGTGAPFLAIWLKQIKPFEDAAELAVAGIKEHGDPERDPDYYQRYHPRNAPKRPEGTFHDFKDDADADRWRGIYYGSQWTGSLTEREWGELSAYSINDYAEVNSYLRGFYKPPPGGGGYKTAQLDRMISHLDSALAKKPLPSNTILYRIESIDWDAEESPVNLRWGSYTDLTDLIGRSMTDKGFMSTSASRDIGRWIDGEYLLRLHVPAGVPAGAIWGGISRSTREKEVVLGRGLRYTVTGVDETPRDRREGLSTGNKFYAVIDVDVSLT